MILDIAEVICIIFRLALPCRLCWNFFKFVTIFDESLDNPALLQTAINGLKQLDDDDLRLIISNINRLCRDK